MGDDFVLKSSERLPHDLLARLENLKATPEQLARAATIPPEELVEFVEAVERWP